MDQCDPFRRLPKLLVDRVLGWLPCWYEHKLVCSLVCRTWLLESSRFVERDTYWVQQLANFDRQGRVESMKLKRLIALADLKVYGLYAGHLTTFEYLSFVAHCWKLGKYAKIHFYCAEQGGARIGHSRLIRLKKPTILCPHCREPVEARLATDRVMTGVDGAGPRCAAVLWPCFAPPGAGVADSSGAETSSSVRNHVEQVVGKALGRELACRWQAQAPWWRCGINTAGPADIGAAAAAGVLVTAAEATAAAAAVATTAAAAALGAAETATTAAAIAAGLIPNPNDDDAVSPTTTMPDGSAFAGSAFFPSRSTSHSHSAAARHAAGIAGANSGRRGFRVPPLLIARLCHSKLYGHTCVAAPVRTGGTGMPSLLEATPRTGGSCNSHTGGSDPEASCTVRQRLTSELLKLAYFSMASGACRDCTSVKFSEVFAAGSRGSTAFEDFGAAHGSRRGVGLPIGERSPRESARARTVAEALAESPVSAALRMHGALLCQACARDNQRHRLIAPTAARSRYLLADADFQELRGAVRQRQCNRAWLARTEAMHRKQRGGKGGQKHLSQCQKAAAAAWQRAGKIPEAAWLPLSLVQEQALRAWGSWERLAAAREAQVRYRFARREARRGDARHGGRRRDEADDSDGCGGRVLGGGGGGASGAAAAPLRPSSSVFMLPPPAAALQAVKLVRGGASAVPCAVPRQGDGTGSTWGCGVEVERNRSSQRVVPVGADAGCIVGFSESDSDPDDMAGGGGGGSSAAAAAQERVRTEPVGKKRARRLARRARCRAHKRQRAAAANPGGSESGSEGDEGGEWLGAAARGTGRNRTGAKHGGPDRCRSGSQLAPAPPAPAAVSPPALVPEPVPGAGAAMQERGTHSERELLARFQSSDMLPLARALLELFLASMPADDSGGEEGAEAEASCGALQAAAQQVMLCCGNWGQDPDVPAPVPSAADAALWSHYTAKCSAQRLYLPVQHPLCRLLVHLLCKQYGLLSTSQTGKGGGRVVAVTHTH
jgi:hypothetical protein